MTAKLFRCDRVVLRYSGADERTMISESWYWKKPLLGMANRLRKLSSARRLTQRQLVQIERDVFIGFYSVRKLIETRTKLTDATKSLKIRVDWHPNRKPVDWLNSHRIDELYDLDDSQSETRDLMFISGRIIHSFIFAPWIDEHGGLAGLFFTSDTDKDRRLYSMSVDSVIDIFELVGNDDPKEDPLEERWTIRGRRA